MIELGQAFWTITGDTKQLRDDVQKSEQTVEQSTSSMSRSFQDVARSTRKVGYAVGAMGTAATAAFTGLAVNFANTGGAIKDLAAETGMGIEQVQIFNETFQKADLETRDFTRSIRRMTRNIRSWIEEGEIGNEYLRDFGVTIQDLKNLGPAEMMIFLQRAISGLTTEQQKLSVATDIFGQNLGNMMVRKIGDFNQALSASETRLKSQNRLMSEESVESAKALQDAWEEVVESLRMFAIQLGELFAEDVRTFVEYLTTETLPKTQEWIERNKELIQTVAKAALAISALSAVVGTSLGVISDAFISLFGILYMFNTIWGMMMGKDLARIVGGISKFKQLGFLIRHITRNLRGVGKALLSVLARIGVVIGAVISAIGFFWTAIIAIIAGIGVAAYYIIKNWDDVKYYLEESWEIIKELWSNFADYLKEKWEQFGEWLGRATYNVFKNFKDFFEDPIGHIVDFWKDTWNTVLEVFEAFGNTLLNVWENKWDLLKTSFEAFYKFIINLPKHLGTAMGKVLNLMLEGIYDLWELLKSIPGMIKDAILSQFDFIISGIHEIGNALSWLSDWISKVFEPIGKGFRSEAMSTVTENRNLNTNISNKGLIPDNRSLTDMTGRTAGSGSQNPTQINFDFKGAFLSRPSDINNLSMKVGRQVKDSLNRKGYSV